MAGLKGPFTRVSACHCTNKGQDTLHGKGNRVHNALQGQKKRGWRCTGCGLTKET